MKSKIYSTDFLFFFKILLNFYNDIFICKRRFIDEYRLTSLMNKQKDNIPLK